tara:strand:+ start:477 stop:653 length:177 start_codon:yes stop_codon:yes gene_type:complete
MDAKELTKAIEHLEALKIIFQAELDKLINNTFVDDTGTVDGALQALKIMLSGYRGSFK